MCLLETVFVFLQFIIVNGKQAMKHLLTQIMNHIR